jgi:hypothetical protein
MILARAFVLDSGTLVNADHVSSVTHVGTGIYNVTVDLAGVELPAGTVAGDFKVFATAQRTFGPTDLPEVWVAYQATSLGATSLVVQIRTAHFVPQQEEAVLVDSAFSFEVVLFTP